MLFHGKQRGLNEILFYVKANVFSYTFYSESVLNFYVQIKGQHWCKIKKITFLYDKYVFLNRKKIRFWDSNAITYDVQLSAIYAFNEL